MTWSVEFSEAADKSFAKLDKSIQNQIVKKMAEISKLEDPRQMGKALVANYSGLWRYRVGNYRVVCDIEDNKLIILVIDIDHRSKVYQKRR